MLCSKFELIPITIGFFINFKILSKIGPKSCTYTGSAKLVAKFCRNWHFLICVQLQGTTIILTFCCNSNSTVGSIEPVEKIIIDQEDFGAESVAECFQEWFDVIETQDIEQQLMFCQLFQV